MFEPLIEFSYEGKIHIGVLDLKIIANDTNLLMILISTTFAASGSTRVSNEAKLLWEFKF